MADLAVPVSRAALGLLLAGSMLFSAGAALANNGGSSAVIALSGKVPVRSTLRVASTPFATVLASQGAFNNARLARIFGDSNADTSFSVAIISENAQQFGEPVLANSEAVPAGGGSTVPYTLTYGGQELQFENAEVALNASQARLLGEGGSRDLRISTAAAANGQAQLGDTLHFILRAN